MPNFSCSVGEYLKGGVEACFDVVRGGVVMKLGVLLNVVSLASVRGYVNADHSIGWYHSELAGNVDSQRCRWP